MNTVVIVGASGVVGARVLHHLLGRDDIARVIAVGRRILPLRHEKLVSKVVDLQNTAAIAAEKKVRQWARDGGELVLGQQRLRVRDLVELIERELHR